ncbi:hypothetical protein SPRG_19691 [Saprolegnia parasitica CBS 223.65]|uniref:Major facilitator superfamily (MFS) profile domain-containing protein n=1 Tax=Saprolegnia parasitica (strain CBS 223.65) TaxID=695850 RepID=A0A067CSK7_SAPPC|nr:hypothetical protein SPRG_19691 [Saprolegnia parasitica CBS 223.65]KDO29772.1 hypothetical protein SPRG_19691 [Saprolegnia parasitica CBS 223.65]|eukprot:XP_012199517.1 hypothetical protein SPRG_19691 [Saprolegnia parasitica CBS 223.65]
MQRASDVALRYSTASIDKLNSDLSSPVYTSREVLALLVQYGCAGILLGGFSSISYPLFTGYFHMTGAQSNSVKTLMGLGWTCKVFFGLVTDCVPICGYRRKSWIILGWLCCLAVMLGIVCMDLGRPYYGDPALMDIPPENLTAADLAQINESAPTTGGTLAILLGLATAFYVVTDSAADGLVIEYAQREPVSVRGRIQSLAYAVRTACCTISMVIVGVCMNSPRFAGSFDWDFGVNTIFLVFCAPCVLMPPVAYLFILDTKMPPLDLRSYVQQTWTTIQRRATWQLVLFIFFSQLLGGYSLTTTAGPYVMMVWANVTNLQSQIQAMAYAGILSMVVAIIGKYGTHWNWRVVVVSTTLSVVAIDSVVQFCTIFNVWRSPYFYLGAPLVESVPLGIQYIVTTFLIAEVAGVGNEGMMVGLFMTTFNLPSTVGPVLANMLYASFEVDATSITADSMATRYQVAYSYLVYYAAMLLSCVTVVLLPPQKAELHQLQRDAGSYPRVATAVCIFIAVMFVTAVTGSVLSMYPSTSCLLLAGGSGCE